MRPSACNCLRAAHAWSKALITRPRRRAVAAFVWGPVLVAALIAVPGPGADAVARTFRDINPIARPGALPEGAQRVVALKPVDRQLVVKALHSIARAWNTGALGPLLADDFTNGSRLLDTLAEVVPRDARLRILSVRSVSTLDQYRQLERDSGKMRQVSTVSAIVDTQIEFNDPDQGFQRLDGTSEYVLRITEPVR